jgi:hypothetical protein
VEDGVPAKQARWVRVVCGLGLPLLALQLRVLLVLLIPFPVL